MIEARVPVPAEKIAAFCRKWNVVELAPFGSVLREGFRPDSDADVLLTFAPNDGGNLWDLIDMSLGKGRLQGPQVLTGKGLVVSRPADCRSARELLE